MRCAQLRPKGANLPVLSPRTQQRSRPILEFLRFGYKRRSISEMVPQLSRFLGFLALVPHGATTTTPPPLNMTAISSRGGYSVLECWQLASVPVDAMSAANYVIGESTKATWSRIQPRTHVGEAWAPTVQ